MYKQLTPLKSTDHSHLRLLPVTDHSYARSELVAPIVIDEIADVAREYPIVFPTGGALPVALMGVEKDSNAYVGVKGEWLANYIPAHIRQYPLTMARVPGAAATPKDESQADAPERFVVLLDVESPLVSATDGEPLFRADGKPGPAAAQRMRLMEQMPTRARLTQRLVQAIEAAGVLTERAIRIRRTGEADRQVTGVRVIDEAALNKLDDATFSQLRASGALPLVYAALLSWANFRQGPIGRSHPVPVAPADDVIRFG